MDRGYDAIIIGSGIIGLSTGYYLSKSGKKVLVLEKKDIGNGASGSCDDAILLQSKKPGIVLEMALESLDMYRGLSGELGTDLEFTNPGAMILIETEDDLRVMEDFVIEQRKCGLDVKIVDKAQVKKRQPHVSEGVIASTYSAIDAQVNPLRVMFAFAGRGKELGMQIKKSAEVVSIERNGSGDWTIATAGGERYVAETVINAAGTWAPHIGKMVGLDIPIKPKRGQIAVTEQVPPLGETNVWSADYIVSKLNPGKARKREKRLEDLGVGFSFTRTAEGNCFIGSTREYVGYNKNTTFEALQIMVSQASRFFPVMNNVSIIRSFAGLRPACRDGKPIIGETSSVPGFFIAAGHEGDGIALAPVTGKTICNLVLGRRNSLDIQELNFDRFLGKEGGVA